MIVGLATPQGNRTASIRQSRILHPTSPFTASPSPAHDGNISGIDSVSVVVTFEVALGVSGLCEDSRGGF